jgi:hypothetical protein
MNPRFITRSCGSLNETDKGPVDISRNWSMGLMGER